MKRASRGCNRVSETSSTLQVLFYGRRKMTALKAALYGLTLSLLIVFCVGCADDILDPTQIGRYRPIPTTNVILNSLGVADEPDPTYPGAEPPGPDDLIDYERDYVFGPGDVLQISIYELRREGQLFTSNYIVTESGRVSIPDVGLVRATGLTEVKLEEEIKAILSPGILKDPSVTVLLLQSQSQLFSIYGQGVAQKGRFPIPRYTFRLTDAIAIAGDVGQFNVTYIYVSRDVPVTEQPVQPTIPSAPVYPKQPVGRELGDKIDPGSIELKPIEREDPKKRPVIREEDMLELIKPYTGNLQNKGGGIIIAATELATEEELEEMALPLELRMEKKIPPRTGEGTNADVYIHEPIDNTRVEWIFEDGKWFPMRIGGVAPVMPPAVSLQEPAAGEYGWGQVGRGAVRKRVIKIPVDRLKNGDPQYDIIIRPGDRISVPIDIIGEFWIGGNVNSRGVIPLTGRPINLKMAITMAGGLGPLAWPKKVEVVRRLGKNKAGLVQEETVMVDLDKIAKGQQPDFFIKPFDLINVGTHGTSRWQAVLRNAFRATYGFGFIYDRNFANRDLGNDPFPGHFGVDTFF